MEKKSQEIYKLIDAILRDTNLSFFTYKKLQTFTDLSLAEIRTIINILCEFNVIYPKKKMGLFKNSTVTNWLFLDDFKEDETEEEVIFSTDKWSVKFNKFEFSLLEYIPEMNSCNSAKLLTIIVLAHFQANFYYEKTFEPGENGSIQLVRKALRCSDEQVYFTSILQQPKMVIYR